MAQAFRGPVADFLVDHVWDALVMRPPEKKTEGSGRFETGADDYALAKWAPSPQREAGSLPRPSRCFSTLSGFEGGVLM